MKSPDVTQVDFGEELSSSCPVGFPGPAGPTGPNWIEARGADFNGYHLADWNGQYPAIPLGDVTEDVMAPNPGKFRLKIAAGGDAYRIMSYALSGNPFPPHRLRAFVNYLRTRAHVETLVCLPRLEDSTVYEVVGVLPVHIGDADSRELAVTATVDMISIEYRPTLAAAALLGTLRDAARRAIQEKVDRLMGLV